jgi:hypothetical protein
VLGQGTIDNAVRADDKEAKRRRRHYASLLGWGSACVMETPIRSDGRQ